MSSSKTSNYQLNQWVKSDRVLMSEFNADNAKIDAALAGKASASALNSLSSTVSGKASQSALDSLSATVNTKASQSALNSLSQTVSQHTTSLAKKGNCTLYTTSYTGDGTTNTKTLTFPGQPQLVVIGGGSACLIMVRGCEHAPAALGNLYQNAVSWSGNSVSWSHNGSGGANSMMNFSGTAYTVLAFLKAD